MEKILPHRNKESIKETSKMVFVRLICGNCLHWVEVSQGSEAYCGKCKCPMKEIIGGKEIYHKPKKVS